jgi:hypothetical protein
MENDFELLKTKNIENINFNKWNLIFIDYK